MYCGNCGKSIPEDARYCCYCGKSTDPNSQNNNDKFIWEYCEIAWAGKYSKFRTLWSDAYFWAKAIGKKGVYNAGESPRFKSHAVGYGQTDKEKQIAVTDHTILIEQLIKDGWEPTGELGSIWWDQKFRRKVIG
jgi:hypothetical protein